MPNVTQPAGQSNTANGTTTPATVAQTGVTAGDLLVACIGCVGSTATSIATPTGDSWTTINNQGGSGSGVPSFGMWVLPNAGAGTHTPSAVLTGTLTGWVITIFEFTATGANEGDFHGNVQVNTATTQMVNIFPQNQTDPNRLFFYSVLRIGATTIATPVSGLNNWSPIGYPAGASSWSNSVQPLANVQGLSLDFYWGTSNNAWPCPYPSTGGGVLSAAVNSVQIRCYCNSQATIPSPGGLVTSVGGGANAQVVPNFMQGMIGG